MKPSSKAPISISEVYGLPNDTFRDHLRHRPMPHALREMKVVAQLRLAERSIGQIARQMGIPVATAALWSQIGHVEEKE